MNPQSRRTVMICTNIPNPYRIPLFNKLYTRLNEIGWDLFVVFGRQGYRERLFDLDMQDCHFPFVVLGSSRLRLPGAEKPMMSYRGILKLIRSRQPECVIVPGFSIATLKIWWYSYFGKYKYVIWSGSHGTRQMILRWPVILYRKMLVRRASGYIVYGSLAREYMISIGAKAEKVEIAYNTVDLDFFRRKTGEKKNIRNNADPKKHLLFVGYLLPRKNVHRILEVFRILNQTRDDVILDIVGDGPDRSSLESYVNANSLTNAVTFHGFKQKTELPGLFAACDCFLFQTDFDIWGLVLNEAMAAGLCCLSSIRAGATHDLIVDGRTGFAVDYTDTEAVVERLNWLLDHPEEIEKVGHRAREYVFKKASLDRSAQGFVEVISR